MTLPTRKTARLHWGRVSLTGAHYFVTACTHQRAPVLTEPTTTQKLHDVFKHLHASGDATFHATTIMPDHVHMLFTLGGRLTIGQLIGKFKALSRDHGRAGWKWQGDAFEHRLRTDESSEHYGFYIFMNPYAAGLCALSEVWPGWYCPDHGQFLFPTGLSETGTPPAEWLKTAEALKTKIAVPESLFVGPALVVESWQPTSGSPTNQSLTANRSARDR
jgi:putative transposase